MLTQVVRSALPDRRAPSHLPLNAPKTRSCWRKTGWKMDLDYQTDTGGSKRIDSHKTKQLTGRIYSTVEGQ